MAFDTNVQSFIRTAEAARDAAGAASENYAALVRELDDLIAYVQQVESTADAAVAKERELRITADRHRERFRYALYVYLQERDGVLGVHAPSHDTLTRIRELLEERP